MLIDLTFKLSLPLLLVLLIAFPACGGFEEPRQVYVWNFARKPLASALAATRMFQPRVFASIARADFSTNGHFEQTRHNHAAWWLSCESYL